MIGLLQAYYGIQNLILTPIGLSSMDGKLEFMRLFSSFIISFLIQIYNVKCFHSIMNKLKLYFISYMRNKPRAVSAHKSSQLAQEQARTKTRYQKLKTDISQNDRQVFNRRNRIKQFKYHHKYLGKSRFQQPERIKEQNLNLKGFINELQEQLNIQKSIIEMNKKKTNKYVKQFNRQFDKQLYYLGKNPNSYMISGIKQQYQNIKQLYADKCGELQMILKDNSYTDLQEKNSYIEALQNQNQILKEKVRSFVDQKQQYGQNFYDRVRKRSQVDKIYNQYGKQQIDNYLTNQISQLKIQNQQLQGQLQKLKEKTKAQTHNAAELNKKITFLEHLIIQKDNNQYKSRLQAKKLMTKINNYENQINNFGIQIKNKQKNYENKLRQVIETETKKYQIQFGIFKKSLLDKNDIIAKLEKQVRYLTTLLSYWKPLDQINREMKKQNNSEEAGKQQKNLFFNNKMNNKISSQLRSQPHSQNSKQFSRKGQNEYEKMNRANTEQGNYLKVKVEAHNRTNSNRNLDMLHAQHKIKKPQSCQMRHNNQAKKVRRISIQQIKLQTQLAKYRFIGYNYELSTLRDIFDLKNYNPNEEDSFSRSEVISMRQIKNILQQKPFFLEENDSVSIARFIVEEGSSDFVYLDENNEIEKVIAISILKNLIGQAKPMSFEQISKEWQNLKKIYLSNIIAALRVLAPKGVISYIKLMQLLLGLGIEMTQQFKDWIIASLVIASTSLNELRYQILFKTQVNE